MKIDHSWYVWLGKGGFGIETNQYPCMAQVDKSCQINGFLKNTLFYVISNQCLILTILFLLKSVFPLAFLTTHGPGLFCSVSFVGSHSLGFSWILRFLGVGSSSFFYAMYFPWKISSTLLFVTTRYTDNSKSNLHVRPWAILNYFTDIFIQMHISTSNSTFPKLHPLSDPHPSLLLLLYPSYLKKWYHPYT